jgi:hypothetical protein
MNIGIPSIPASPVSQTGSPLVPAPQAQLDISRYAAPPPGRGGFAAAASAGHDAEPECPGPAAPGRRPRRAFRARPSPIPSPGTFPGDLDHDFPPRLLRLASARSESSCLPRPPAKSPAARPGGRRRPAGWADQLESAVANFPAA